MTTTTVPTTGTTAPGRAPAPVIAAAAIAALLALVGGYGAIYFTGLEGYTDIGVTFLVAYEFLAALGLTCAVALLQRRAWGRWGLTVYAVWMAAFTVFKLVTFQEWEATTFGLLGLVVLTLLLRPASRSWAAGS
jgi:hypothetical protein